MTVSATSSTTSTTATTGTTLTQPAGAVGNSALTQDDFMKLFVAQMQYQDPMKPMDNYQMASQMAQFASLQATEQMGTDMQNLLSFQTSQNNLQLVSLIGNTVQVSGDAVGVTGGKAGSAEFTLASPAQSIQVTVYDKNNQPVWQQNVGSQGAGDYQLPWNGSDSSGNPVADGQYTYQVKALDATGTQLPVTYSTSGKVTGVDFSNGVATVAIDNGTTAKVSDIIKVMNSSSASLSSGTGTTQPTGTATATE
jgi:flagellar basal-body rod modification protein FlgD